ncbi:hypothetical protein N7474_002955 [Penicillium riverlandense]|uniref:uncharacterized protein n=1 Tax=Penicillium riverlandense TaxID=1903569 RepID=UPI0025470CE4|nr:uncharacterized protein N7474_002955 [Penicillium riverlandense]KAJ5825817.1 hypothetical protein N7474_002955 [Penicillium riverlandense]
MSSERYGMMLWHPTPPESDADCLVDIVFLHGLNGSIGNTFTQNTGRIGRRAHVTWPKDLLQHDLTADGVLQARIMGFGFDADVFNFFGRAGRETIASTADTFLAALADMRREDYQRERPLIFFGHSLGGLIIKRALSKAWHEDDPSSGDVFRRRRLTASSTRAIIFAGTPHRGANAAHLATWGTAWLAAFGVQTSTENIRELQIGANTTQMLRDEFLIFRRRIRDQRTKMTPPRPDITIYTFCESLPMPIGGIIVTRESAVIDGQNEIVASVLQRDHRTMVKFGSRDEIGYKQFVSAMKDVIDEVRRERTSSTSSPSTPVSYGSLAQGHEWALNSGLHQVNQQTPPQHILYHRPSAFLAEYSSHPPQQLVPYFAPSGAYLSSRDSSESSRSPQSVSPAIVSAYQPYEPFSVHWDSDTEEIANLLVSGTDRRLSAVHRTDTEHAITLFERALHRSQQSRKPDPRHQTKAYFGIADCFSDLSESPSRRLNASQKLDYHERAKNACREALQLAQESDSPGQLRRARVYQARFAAQEVILKSQRGHIDSDQLRRSKDAAETALRNVMFELERDVHRDHSLWDIAERKLLQLEHIRV